MRTETNYWLEITRQVMNTVVTPNKATKDFSERGSNKAIFASFLQNNPVFWPVCHQIFEQIRQLFPY